MDEIHHIKSLHREGYSTREIARKTGFNRETVMKYIKKKISIPSPIKRPGKSVLTPYIPRIREMLTAEKAFSNRKHHLTAKRFHSLITSGKLDETLPALEVSVRSVERAVRAVRISLKAQNPQQHLRLLHEPGKAQIDFGEVEMLCVGEERRFFILVMSFPHSNFRLAQVLPAQNFECLAHGLIKMFERIGRVPTVLRCDNMSTAVAKVIHHRDLGKGEANHDTTDHPRKLTENFIALMSNYDFDAEFCNPNSGYEKGSVENAVGWVRRNFFSPLRKFDDDFESLNEELMDFCFLESQKAHYKHRDRKIEDLFKEDLAVMLPLPDEPFDACSWSEGTVSKDCRVQFEKNTYQVDSIPGAKIRIKRYWDRLVFMTDRGEVLGEHRRTYDSRKDNIDWGVELRLLSERPSAFSSSFLRSILPEAAAKYLQRLRAPDRAVLLKALCQCFEKSGNIKAEVLLLDTAIQCYENHSVEEVSAAYRGGNDVAPDAVRPLENLPGPLGRITLPHRDIGDALAVLGRNCNG